MDERELPLLTHLGELRTCLIKALCGLAFAMAFCYAVVEPIMAALRKPIMQVLPEQASLVVLSPQEYFFTELKAALIAGLALASPWIFYQLWTFIAPGLYRHEKRLGLGFIAVATACFIAGIFFAYFLVLPPTFRYFIDSLPPEVHGAYSIGMLYGFAITVLLAFGLVFQTPLLVFMMVLFGLMPYEALAGSRRYIFVGCFIVGAILTPPDPITQIMLALPTYGLFELGLLFSRMVAKRSRVKNEQIGEGSL